MHIIWLYIKKNKRYSYIIVPCYTCVLNFFKFVVSTYFYHTGYNTRTYVCPLYILELLKGYVKHTVPEQNLWTDNMSKLGRQHIGPKKKKLDDNWNKTIYFSKATRLYQQFFVGWCYWCLLIHVLSLFLIFCLFPLYPKRIIDYVDFF